MEAQPVFADGASFYWLRHDRPTWLDFYRARVVDGMGKIVHERLFAIEIPEGGEPSLRADLDIGRCEDQKNRGVEGAAGLLKIAIDKHDELCRRRERRREELERQKALHLEGVERFAAALVLPHPERERPDLRNLRPNPETEATAMRVGRLAA